MFGFSSSTFKLRVISPALKFTGRSLFYYTSIIIMIIIIIVTQPEAAGPRPGRGSGESLRAALAGRRSAPSENSISLDIPKPFGPGPESRGPSDRIEKINRVLAGHPWP
jgi:hypothetical protein